MSDMSHPREATWGNPTPAPPPTLEEREAVWQRNTQRAEAWRSLGLGWRIVRPLLIAGLYTAEDVRKLGENGVLRIPGLGRLAVKQLGEVIGGWPTTGYAKTTLSAYTTDDLLTELACRGHRFEVR